jgi:hypothetical protein
MVDHVADALGEKDTNRASHVDSVNDLTDAARDWLWKNYKGPVASTQVGTEAVVYPKNKWFADLLPVNGPVLGPFNTRDEGLAAEHVWLHEHGIPVPGQDKPEVSADLVQHAAPPKQRDDLDLASGRLAWLRDNVWGGSQVAMANDTGINQGSLSNVFTSKRGAGRALLEKIAEHPRVNDIWLLTGRGGPR